MSTAEGGQGDATLLAVGEIGLHSIAADAGCKRNGRNIHSTNDSGHGNLPCMCDGKSLATVRSCVTRAAVPEAERRWTTPQGRREPHARGGTDRSVPPPHQSLQKTDPPLQ